MKLNLYRDSFANYRLSIKVLITVCALLFLLTVVFAYVAVSRSQKVRENFVLVPPRLAEPVVIGDEVVDRKYLVTMAHHAVYLVTTFTHATVEKQFDAFLAMTAPESYAKIKAQLLDQAGVVKRQRIVQAFLVQDMKVTVLKKEAENPVSKKRIALSPGKGKVVVTGYLFRRISSGPIIDKGFYRITLHYLMRFGQFQVTGIRFEPLKENPVEKQIIKQKRKEKRT